MIRKFNPETDYKNLYRIWYEIGWIEGKEEEKAVSLFLEGSKSLVTEVNGEVEGFVNSTPSSLQYLDEDLKLSAITAVTVSRVARKQGIARKMTAKSMAEAASEGYLLSGLGMFEQGFYNQLGFGTGSYEHFIKFDPAHLKIKAKIRPPKRITYDDWKVVHQARIERRKHHGYCTLLPSSITRAELLWTKKKGFGLGYFDGIDGKLSHFFWCIPDDVEHGPYNINLLVYENKKQFLELMALIKSLGDQVHLVNMIEPAGIQLQDLIKQPFKGRRVTRNNDFASLHRASAFWQMRILDLAGCLERTHLRGEQIRFNLILTDPIEKYLSSTGDWLGISGQYIVTLGEESGARAGYDPELPELKASVGAFTRMWLGVRPASGLAITDKISAPEHLLEQLDRILRIPQPRVDWDF